MIHLVSVVLGVEHLSGIADAGIVSDAVIYYGGCLQLLFGKLSLCCGGNDVLRYG